MLLQEENPLQLKDIDYIEFYVGNVCQAAHFYYTTLGFKPIAYAGLETGIRDHVSFVSEHHSMRLMLTGALSPESPISQYVNLHGDSVKDIAFTVNDAAHAFTEAVMRGARPIMEPTVFGGKGEQVIKATIAAYGDTVHSFIQRDINSSTFLPNYQAIEHPLPDVITGLLAMDHLTISVEQGKLNQWVDFYTQVLGFHESHQEYLETEYSGMNSKVVQNNTGCIKFPIVEPAPGNCRSQIEEFLSFHRGPGIQHIALLSNNIVETVRTLRNNGIEFLQIPDIYYDEREEHIGDMAQDITVLRELNILVDRDEGGYLLQTFTKPLQSRPTVFLEIIQRQGASSFGRANIKALFKAVEREQALRGNLL